MRLTFKQYRRSQVAELADWVPGFDMAGVSVSEADKAAGSPRAGDKIARNPANHADRWLVAADYFAANFEPIASLSSRDEALEEALKKQALLTAYYNGHGDGEDMTKTYGPGGPTLWERYMCKEGIRALRSPELNAAPQKDGHSERMPQRDGPADTLQACGNPPAGAAPDRSPIHTPTEDCGFDRNGSHNAGHYVCMCGWEDSTDRAIHDAPDRTSGGAMPEEPAFVALANKIVGNGHPGALTKQELEWLSYTNSLRQWALRRPAPPADGWIACGERQPDNDEPVLIWYNQRPRGWRVYLGYYLRELNQWRPDGGNGDFSDQITHWMPLPASPEAGGRG